MEEEIMPKCPNMEGGMKVGSRWWETSLVIMEKIVVVAVIIMQVEDQPQLMNMEVD